EAVHGLCHITGGGFTDNIPRVVPDGLCVHVDTKAWQPLPIFTLIGECGGVDIEEMYRVFNMGIGMVVIAASDVDLIKIKGAGAVLLGEVTSGEDKVRLAF
ncbi:MAG: phosphoribosylformylglycinamidine cyclo-ligase, partial [Candidatus Krumholzibacteriia bacterium]